MGAKLAPGDRISFVQNGRKLRGVVADTLNLKVRVEELLIPVVRPRNGVKHVTAHLDHAQQRHLKTRWIQRCKLRKLPSK